MILFCIDFAITKYKEKTWQGKIKIGMTEKQFLQTLPIASGPVFNLAHGVYKSGGCLLTDGTELKLTFYIPKESITRDQVNGDWDISMSEYVLKDYKIKSNKKIQGTEYSP